MCLDTVWMLEHVRSLAKAEGGVPLRGQSMKGADLGNQGSVQCRTNQVANHSPDLRTLILDAEGGVPDQDPWASQRDGCPATTEAKPGAPSRHDGP